MSRWEGNKTGCLASRGLGAEVEKEENRYTEAEIHRSSEDTQKQ
jgi:hypothetical protein